MDSRMRQERFTTNHHNHFINLAMIEEDIKKAIEIAAEAMDVMIKNNPEVYKK